MQKFDEKMCEYNIQTERVIKKVLFLFFRNGMLILSRSAAGRNLICCGIKCSKWGKNPQRLIQEIEEGVKDELMNK